MPEGDTVWRTARLLDRALTGHVLATSDFRVPELATVDLTGTRIIGTATHGKHLLTRLTDDRTRWTLHTHLKMEGAWQVYVPGERWRRPAHTARVVLGTAARQAVGFSLGVVELLPHADEHRVTGHLGPDLMHDDFDPDEAVRRLVAEPETPLVEALQDQRRVAGLGNMYACELCFLTGRHPTSPVGDVPDPERLVRRARTILLLNRERAHQSTTGDLRQGRRHWVYRQQACRRCGTQIATDMVGRADRERATYWCPSCQPGG